MPARVSSDDVAEILDNKTNADNVDAAITVANTLVNKITGLTEAELKEIERWLAAHFVAIYNPVTQQRTSIGDTITDYARGSLGRGLDYTPYGQQVKLLDTTGTLAQLDIDSVSKKPQMHALG